MNQTICTEYFAGCNTGKGFINYLPFALEGVDRVFILKGSPGSGKSSLMKKIAVNSEHIGMGVERIFCSSDPQSLDGIIIRDVSVAVIDGTSPHSAEAKCPGAVETIVNLGEYWDTDSIRAQREEILTFSKVKSECFNEAYLLLSGADKIRAVRRNAVAKAFDKEKALNTVKKIFSKNAVSGKGDFSYRLSSAFGIDGLKTLNTFGKASKKYILSDRYGVSCFLLEMMLKLAIKNDVSVTVSPDPFDTDAPAAIYFDESDVAFLGRNAIYQYNDIKVINTERFIEKDVLFRSREKIKFLDKCEASIKKSAAEALFKAKEAHIHMENIYSGAMNFSELDALVDVLSEEIFF